MNVYRSGFFLVTRVNTHTDKTRSDHSIDNLTIEDGMCINCYFCVKTFQEKKFK